MVIDPHSQPDRWRFAAHPCFAEAYIKLVGKVENLKLRYPDSYQQKGHTRLLAMVEKAIDEIKADPGADRFRQGTTLGNQHKHWFRARFGNGRFRLFYRYSSEAKTIVFGWMNDDETLRTYGSKTDAYAVFAKMLSKKHPPDDWDELLNASTIDPEYLGPDNMPSP